MTHKIVTYEIYSCERDIEIKIGTFCVKVQRKQRETIELLSMKANWKAHEVIT